MKRNTYSLCDGVYKNAQKHNSDDFWKKRKDSEHMFVVWSRRPQWLFMMAEVIHVFAKKVAGGAKTLLPSLKQCRVLEAKHILFMMTKTSR